MDNIAQYKTEQVSISKIRIGDTVIHEDVVTTVGRENIKYCSFMGMTIFGDSYRSGHKLITRVLI